MECPEGPSNIIKKIKFFDLGSKTKVDRISVGAVEDLC
jgi:hypothetical protein